VEVTIPTLSPVAARYGGGMHAFDRLEESVDDEHAFVQSTYHHYAAAAYTVSRTSPPPARPSVLLVKRSASFLRLHGAARGAAKSRRVPLTQPGGVDCGLWAATKPTSSKRVVTVAGSSGKGPSGTTRKAPGAKGATQHSSKLSHPAPPAPTASSSSPTRSVTAARRPLSAVNGSRSVVGSSVVGSSDDKSLRASRVGSIVVGSSDDKSLRASRVGSIVLQPAKRTQTDRVARCVLSPFGGVG
jgi:hypothetical protein